MRKWILLLALALLFNVLQANAEETFYTNNSDRYYHTDPDCDRPGEVWEWYASSQPYEREIYQKYPISKTAAAEFEKTACPVCVQNYAPVYLGDHMPEWTTPDTQPWEAKNGFLDHEISNEKFRNEVSQTHSAFRDYFEQYAEYKTGIIKRKHDYPSCFAGLYENTQGSYTYMIVDPTEDVVNAFEKMFGSGAWIVPAKYGYDEMDAVVLEVMQAIIDWCSAHPEVDAGSAAGGVDEANNCVTISIWGEDWQLVAAAMEEVAPIFVRFVFEEGGPIKLA